MEHKPFQIERTFNSSIEKVWNAITDKDEMKQWCFDIAEFKPEVGFEFRFLGGKDPANPYVHLCKVMEVIPMKKFSYTWRFEGIAGNSLLTFELFEEGKNTRLKLTHAGLETFPADNPDLAEENFALGWTSILDKSLKEYLLK
jgi:uncharacterized protein YndB with AHSA1/START domain